MRWGLKLEVRKRLVSSYYPLAYVHNYVRGEKAGMEAQAAAYSTKLGTEPLTCGPFQDT